VQVAVRVGVMVMVIVTVVVVMAVRVAVIMVVVMVVAVVMTVVMVVVVVTVRVGRDPRAVAVAASAYRAHGVTSEPVGGSPAVARRTPGVPGRTRGRAP